MIRLGLIGCGHWGRNYIKAAEDAGASIRVFQRGEIIGDVDAVCIATHPKDSPALCETVLASGLPVLCEKPAGLSMADAERIQRAEAASTAFVLVGHQHLFAEGFEEMRASGAPDAAAFFTGPTSRNDYSALWDYGPHAVSCLLALNDPPNSHNWAVGISPLKRATVIASGETCRYIYDGYAPAEPPLTRQVRAFAKAVRANGTDDYRFGAKWAVDVARVLETANKQ